MFMWQNKEKFKGYEYFCKPLYIISLSFSIYLLVFFLTHIPEVEGDLQVLPKMFCKLGIHIKNLQNIFSKNFVEVTVGQSPHISVGFTWSGIQVDWFTKNIVLTWKNPKT